MSPATSQLEEFDIVILGGGQAGSFIAWTMAGKGIVEGLGPLFSSVPSGS